jgi:hypothetical protein
MLISHDTEFFKVFGFLKIPGFFSKHEVELMAEEYETGLSTAVPLYNSAVGLRGQMNWSNMQPQMPLLASMLEEGRLLKVARTLVGDGTVGVMSNGNFFSGRFTEWHADTSVSGFRSVKFAAYLDPLEGESGALRVIPGSHRSPWHEELLPIGMKKSLKEVGNPDAKGVSAYSVTEIPAHICSTNPGDLLAFDLKLWHASWNGSSRRRMLSFTYFDKPQSDNELESWRAVVKQLGKEALNRELRRHREWIKAGLGANDIPVKEPQFHPMWLEEANSNALRRKWIETLVSWGMLRLPQNSAHIAIRSD